MEKTIRIAPEGVTIGGLEISATANSGSKYISVEKVRSIFGQQKRVVTNKNEEKLDYWDGISIFENPEISIFSIELRGNTDQSKYTGSVLVEDVPINSGTSITLLNTSIEKGSFKEIVSLRHSDSSLWDLSYPGFTVRIACDGGSKIKSVIITPAEISTLLPQDATLIKKLLGYWSSPRHEYLFKNDGISYMVGGTTKNKWKIEKGRYLQDGQTYEIVLLTDEKFIFRDLKNPSIQFTLARLSNEHIKSLRQYYSEWMDQHR